MGAHSSDSVGRLNPPSRAWSRLIFSFFSYGLASFVSNRLFPRHYLFLRAQRFFFSGTNLGFSLYALRRSAVPSSFLADGVRGSSAMFFLSARRLPFLRANVPPPHRNFSSMTYGKNCLRQAQARRFLGQTQSFRQAPRFWYGERGPYGFPDILTANRSLLLFTGLF